MKYILSCLLIFLIGSNTFAKKNEIDADAHEESCKNISKFAYIVMDARQGGVRLSKMLDITKKGSEEKLRSIENKIILDAYEQTKYESEEYKESARVDFADKYMLACMKMYE